MTFARQQIRPLRKRALCFAGLTLAGALCYGVSFTSSSSPSLRYPFTRHKEIVAARPCSASEALSWDRFEKLIPSSVVPEPRVIDSALEPDRPELNGLTLFRERHGWCPYSERVWLALEVKGLQYETVLIDNTGPGRRPAWFTANTPQIRWENGQMQGESLDIVRALDDKYPDAVQLWPNEEVTTLINEFKSIFPKGTRPSSRAAFLFKDYGDMPVWRIEFEATLNKTDSLLGQYDDGPFFYGAQFTAADIAWAPFLERYSEQLPCLHAGLDPRDPVRWPRLAAWYKAMMQLVPAYGARVCGDSVSWRKVLSMAGYGNAGIAPVLQNPEVSSKSEVRDDIVEGDWKRYSSSRPYIAPTPQEEAASRIVRNRAAIAADAVGRGALADSDADVALLGLAALLVGVISEEDVGASVAAAAVYLDERMCVPRDMGRLPARVVRKLSERLRRRFQIGEVLETS